jgi:hypothetical protein
MPRGGKRTPKDGKKLGRPKSTRPVDGNVARKIKERVKATELWVFLIGTAAKKAKDSGNTSDLRQALIYLDDRDMGLCVQPTEDKIIFDPNQPLRVSIEHIGPAHSAPAKTK